MDSTAALGATGHQVNGQVGTVVDEVTFEVERGKIAEFSRAAHVQDAVHTDRREAQRRGLSEVAATATHVVVAGHHRSQEALLETLGLELSRVMVGGTSWEYSRPLVAGDSLTGRRIVTGDEARTTSSGSTLRIITLQTEFRDQHGRLAVRQLETILERGRR
jgi:acyl dehydratase